MNQSASGYERELEVAITAVRDAARVCRAVQASIDPATLEKRDKSPVTVADFASQAVVCRAIHEAFGHDPIIAEEDSAELQDSQNAELCTRVVDHVRALHRGATAEHVCNWIDHGRAKAYSDRFWTLDPIDGTKGFLRKEQYAIALALIVDGRVSVSVLGCPNFMGGKLYTAVHGRGAFALPIAGEGEPRRIHVSATASTAAMRFCESVESGHSSHDDAAQIAAALGVTHPPVRMDSQCKYAAVADADHAGGGGSGADAYLRLPTRAGYVERIWDHAAGFGVLTEAGGHVTDIDGKELDFTQGAGLEVNRGVIATNGRLHEAVLAAVRRQLAPA